MSKDENDEFEEIVKGGQGGAPNQDLGFHTLTEAVQKAYPILYDGVLVRSVLILDRLDGGGARELMWLHDSDTQPWELLGMVQQVLDNTRAENQVAISHAIADDQDDDEEGEQ